MKEKQELQKYSEIGFPLNVYAFITYFETGEFRELHYGLFNTPSDDLLQAQKNSADLLFKYLYKSPAKVLEVGIGLGKTHQKLIDKGFDCIGITPDNAQIKIVKESIPEANLHCIKFEDFTDEKNKYDLVLFQESAQYISPDDIFSQCQKLLSESGRILIVDEFSIGVEHLHNIEKFKEKAEGYGFHVNSFIDLSEQAKPTEDYLLKGLNKYRDEFIKQLNLDTKTMDHLIEAVHEHKKGYEKKERGYFFLELRKKI